MIDLACSLDRSIPHTQKSSSINLVKLTITCTGFVYDIGSLRIFVSDDVTSLPDIFPSTFIVDKLLFECESNPMRALSMVERCCLYQIL